MLSAIVAAGTAADQGAEPQAGARPAVADRASAPDAQFRVEVERFADVRILRYRVPGFEALDARTKQLLYYLYEAALCGREITYDQKYRYNLSVKRTLERIVRHYPGDRETADFRALTLYLKRVWFANGIHHNYAHDKFVPTFSRSAFAAFVRGTPAEFPVRDGQSLAELIEELTLVMFEPNVDAKLVSKSADRDVLESSAVNFYAGLTQREVEAFYATAATPGDEAPVSLGINSRLVKTDGVPVEQVQKVGGRYTQAIERIVGWLEKAAGCAENEAQRTALEKLIRFYRTGSLRDWDDYNIAWLRDTESHVDVINGFIEVYNDPLGMRGTFESIVSFRDPEATRRIGTVAGAAQWFEDHMPFFDRHKKASVTGISGKVITVVAESGDSAPTTPIGVNLPNSDWIRSAHGSKSVTLGNIVMAFNAVRGGVDREFSYGAVEIERGERYGELAATLHVDLHEVVGHGSGQLERGVGPLHETLKNYGSTLEEARADLVALYFAVDPKLVELGLMPSVEVGYAGYDQFIRNGLLQQLNRIELGKDLEGDHMRNRQLIAAWAYEQGQRDNVIERRVRDGKTFFVINDHAKLRALFGRLLRELQRIKSTGDYAAIRELVERYAVKVDPALHAEVRARYAALDVPAHSGFMTPRLVPVRNGDEIVDVRIEYPDDFAAQMLEYAERYAFLPDLELTMNDKVPVKNTVAISLLVALAGVGAVQAQSARSERAQAAAPKVILIIGDGMDQNQITIARNYLVGYEGRLTLDTMPVRSSVQTQTVVEEDPHMPEYVPDSANTATSMASGIVTSTGRIGTTAGTDRDVETIMELAAAAGFGTGIVATSSVTDATPASFVAHVSYRLCEGPRAMVSTNANNPAFSTDCSADLKANGGKGSIAEQIAASRIDVVLGGGERNFAQPAEGETTKTVRDLAVANGFRVISTADELATLKRGGKVLGLFAPGTMPVQLRGAGGAQAQRVQRDENGLVVQSEPFACEPDPAFGATPTLVAMARAALTHLDDGRSFVLMVESSSIDKQSHARRPCGSIGELKQLDDVVAVALEYARTHPETLVLVTADHSQAAQLVPERSWLGPNAASPGHFARIRTPEGAIMGVNYATNDSNLQEDHTGADVPLFAFGAAADEVPAAVRQTDVFHIMRRHLGLAASPTP